MNAAAVYLHFPYCLYKCHYCDFNSYAYPRAGIPQGEYLASLLTELKTRQGLFERCGEGFFPRGTRLGSVFFGGGTPSLMEPAAVARVLTALSHDFVFDNDIEITLEANPGTVDTARFKDFKAAGVNRVSIGVQSFRDQYLEKFGRIHTGEEARRALHAAREAGLARVSGDLIFGFPGQTPAEWGEDLKTALSFGLSHVSAYALTAEEGTRYNQDVRRGLLPEADPEVAADMQELTYELCAGHGLPAYEISNFARPGDECRHNLAYWNYRSYLGLGAGAVSNFVRPEAGARRFTIRHANHKAPDHYMRTLREKSAFFAEESIDQTTAMQEFVLMGLRLAAGPDPERFRRLFGRPLESCFAPAIKANAASGRLARVGERFTVTRAGFLWNHRLVGDFFACAAESRYPNR